MKRIILLVGLILLPLSLRTEISEDKFFSVNSSLQKFFCDESKFLVIQYLKNSWCSAEKVSLIMDLVFSEKPQVCVEIGVFSGSSILPIAYTLKCLDQGVVFAIDSWSNKEAIRNIDGTDPNRAWWSTVNMSEVKNSFLQMLTDLDLEPFCKVIHSSSRLAVNALDAIDFLHLDGNFSEEGSVEIDFLHLDGNFSEEGSVEDVFLYLPKVKQGGYILVSNVHMFVNKKYTKKKSVQLLLNSCEEVCRIENGNAILLRKL